MTSYPANTGGIIEALIDLQLAISGGGSGSQNVSTLIGTTAGEAISKGDAVYVNAGDAKVYKATSIFTRQQANVLGLAKEDALVDTALTVVVRGPLVELSGLTAGSDYFLGSDGQITPTAPTGGGVYSAFVGQAVSATTIDVHPTAPVYLT